MAEQILYGHLSTKKSEGKIKEAINSTFSSLGGTLTETSRGFHISQGTNGISFAFSANLQADVSLREIKAGKHEIEARLKWGMSALSWICLVIGVFVFGILWIVPFLYLFFKPTQAYQQAIDRVQIFLD